MAGERDLALEHSGRLISKTEVEQIRETVELFPRLSLKELASTIAEHLEWYSAGGEVKRDACVKLLLKLSWRGRESWSSLNSGVGRVRYGQSS